MSELTNVIQHPQEAVDKIAALSARVAELETSTYCAYCGEQYPLDDKAATAVSEHIKTCEKHPMRKLEEKWDAKATKYRVERDTLRAENAKLREALDTANLMIASEDFDADDVRGFMMGALK